MSPKIYPKDAWEKTEYVPTKFRGFIELLRPFTLMAPLIGGLSGAFISLAWAEELNLGIDILKLFWGVVTLVFLNAASNTLNQITDLEIRWARLRRWAPSTIDPVDQEKEPRDR